MPPRLKRLIGALMIMAVVLVYAFVAAFIGDVIVTQQSKVIQIAYFLVAGLLWALPVGLIIKWMYRLPGV